MAHLINIFDRLHTKFEGWGDNRLQRSHSCAIESIHRSVTGIFKQTLNVYND